jgi:hypothetical protein
MVDPSEPEIGERQATELVHRLVATHHARADVVEQAAEGGLIHGPHYPDRE